MAKTDIKIYANEAASGKKTTTSITYVNPEADSQTLKTFAQKLNAFTTNNYVETDRIHTINVDTEQVPQPIKNIGTLSLVENPTITKSSNQLRIGIDQLIINGTTSSSIDGEIFGTLYINSTYYAVATKDTSAEDYIYITFPTTPPSGTATLRLAIRAKSPYSAATLTTTITIT